eukprot:scaffold121989_cov69-Phaeocystis_antarctica.AAC.1
MGRTTYIRSPPIQQFVSTRAQYRSPPRCCMPGSFDLVGRRTKRFERRRNVQRHLDAVARASLDGEHAVDAAPDAVPDAVAW